MNEETRELLRDDILPVVLGNGFTAHQLSSRLLARYGLSCTLCGARRNLLDFLDMSADFLRLASKSGGRLVAEQLIDFAELHADRFLLLVPASDSARAFLREQAEILEARFVCVEPSKLEGEWLARIGI